MEEWPLLRWATWRWEEAGQGGQLTCSEGHSQGLPQLDCEGSGSPRPHLPARHIHSDWGSRWPGGCVWRGGLWGQPCSGADRSPRPCEGWVAQPLWAETDLGLPFQIYVHLLSKVIPWRIFRWSAGKLGLERRAPRS